MQANTVLAVLGLAMASSACAMAETENLADPATASLTGEACPDVGERAYFFWMQPRSAEPGDEISLSPYWTDMPGSYNDLPPGCVGDLEAFPEDAVTFDRQDDGLAIASISADAEPGTRVRLEATYRGEYALNGIVDIYREEENPLVGLWRQAGDSCPPESAVRELVFTGGNEMSVTWTPFEVYKDYWADYQYDPQTGAFSFEVEGGNQIPEDIVAAGTAQVDGDRLVFKDVFFGTPRQAEGGCRATFVR